MALGCVCMLFCYLLIAACASGNQFTPVIYPATILSKCGQDNPNHLTTTLQHIKQQLPFSQCSLTNKKSCKEILQHSPSASSGYYQITVPNGSQVQVYCDMNGTNCGGEGGWTRVTYVNMSESGTICPEGLTQQNYSGLTLCGRNTTGDAGCQSTVFSTLGLNYSKVCGQLKGYQVFTPNAFNKHIKSIDSPYVDGASITYGSTPRKHIWTYVNGFNLHTTYKQWTCPCNTDSTNTSPSYVENDYYCETSDNIIAIAISDPLWDGQQCDGVEAPCCTHPNLPWFNKTLNGTTNEDIEVRVCGDQPTSNEDTPLQVIELYVH